MILFLAFIFGLLIGSFLNVCIHRWPREESVVKPRSYCPQCSAAIGWYDNVPLLSYLSLGGKCRHCGARISVRYPLVELLNGLLYVYLAWRLGVEPMTLKIALFGSMMLILIFTDLAEFILPDEITLGGIALGLALSPFIHLEGGVVPLIWYLADVQPPAWVTSVVESLLAAAVLAALLYGIGELYYRIRGVEGLGFGDVKMMAMMGAFWGLPKAILILIMSSLIGAVSGLLIVLITRKQWTYALPFGSYLGATGILVAVWGDEILRWYWGVALSSPT